MTALHPRPVLAAGGALLALFAWAGGCGSEDAPPRPPVPTSSSGTAAQGGGAAGGGGASGGGEVGGGNGGGGEGGTPIPSDEDCYDGKDNDLDGDTDCEDAADCAEACSDPCAAPKVLDNPTEGWEGDNTGHPLMDAAATCTSGQGAGAAVVYRLESEHDGFVDVWVESESADLTLSVRFDCDAPATEQGCSERATDITAQPSAEFLSVPAIKNQSVYIVVEGFGKDEAGTHWITASSHALECGDSHLDPPEQCDDGNEEPNDGCDALCKLESSEEGGNDGFTQADPWSDPWFGAIDPAGDKDYLSFDLPAPYDNLIAFVTDLGNGGCSMGLMDPILTLYGPAKTQIAEDDDGGDVYCPLLPATGLSEGTHYLKVERSITASPTFVYRVWLELGDCGNNIVEAAEECDGGDGCTNDCKSG